MSKMNQLWQDTLERAQTRFYEGRSTREEYISTLKSLGFDRARIDDELWAACEARRAVKQLEPRP